MIYLKGLGKPISYHAFEKKLREKDSEILDLFPNLKENEKGKTIDELCVHIWVITVNELLLTMISP